MQVPRRNSVVRHVARAHGEASTSTNLRVLFICQWFKPEPVVQPGAIVEGLRSQGVHVEVLTGVPNYPSGVVAGGYRAWTRSSEEVEGTLVHRTPLYPSHDARAVRRMANYISWAVSSTALGQRLLDRADVALVYSSPATAALSAMSSSMRGRTPYVLLVQDVWPDSVFSSGFLSGRIGKLLHPLVNAFVQWTYRSAGHIVVISPGMQGLLEDRGVPSSKLSVIHNWVSEATAPPSTDGEQRLRADLRLPLDAFLFMYAGNHGAAQGLDVVIRAVGAVAHDVACHLVLVGDGVDKAALTHLADEVAAGRVHFMEPQPKEQMASLMEQADAQIVSLADQPLFRVTTPSKLQAILAAGQPVLVHASGDAARIVEEANAGLTAPAGDSAVVAEAMRMMCGASPDERQGWGRSGRIYYEKNMSQAVGASRMNHVLRGVALSRQARAVPGRTRKERR